MTKGIYSHRTKNMHGEPWEHFIIYIYISKLCLSIALVRNDQDKLATWYEMLIIVTCCMRLGQMYLIPSSF